MKIKDIHIKNYRQYQDVELSFDSMNEYDLNYILAENGIGKTTLLNAITWCLYEKEYHVSESLKSKTLPVLTLKTLRNMKPNDEEDTSVGITIEDVEGEICFSRSITFRKTEEGAPYEKKRTQKVIISNDGKDTLVVEDEDAFRVEVNKRLPARIQQFFFFDGEQLDTYLANNTGENVEQTVLQISQIDLLVTMKKNLENITTELRRETSRTNSKADEINKEYEKKNKQISDLDEKLTKEKKEFTDATNQLRAIKEELGDDPDIADLEEEREKLDDRARELKEAQNQNLTDRKRFLRKYTTLLKALPRIKDLYDQILEMEKNKEFPPKYDKDELQKMLQECHCNVCGRDLDAGAQLHIAELIKRFELGHETGTLLTRLIASLQAQIIDAGKYEEERDRLFGLKDTLDSQMSEVSERLSELDRTINKFTNKDHIKALHEKRTQLEKFITDTYKQKTADEILIETYKKEAEELYKQFHNELKKDKTHKKLVKQTELAERAQEKVGCIIEEIKSGIRTKISDEMSSKFFELMWKEKFQKVELTETYTASVINMDGYEQLGSCSAAERELLALAFTLALHKESGFDGPLVIDTPISRVSGNLRVMC